MNLESFGFPVDLYPERDAVLLSAANGSTVAEQGTVVSMQSAEAPETPDEQEPQAQEGPEVHAVEKKARAPLDPVDSLSGQVPQPSASENRPSRLPLEACAMLTRDFNAAMGLSERRNSKMHRQD